MKEIVYLPELKTYGVVERYWHDKSIAYITPVDSKYGRWFLPCEVEEVTDKDDYEAAIWQLSEQCLNG